MSWFSLNKTMGSNYTVDPGDIVNTKTALNQLGYYDVPPHRGIDDWTDDVPDNSGGVILAAGRRESNIAIPSQIPQNQRKPNGTPQAQPQLPRGWEYEDERKGTAWDTDNQLRTRETILGIPWWKTVPGRTRSKQR